MPTADAALSVGGALRGATARLAAAGSETARLDAELLLASALGVGRERLVLDRDDTLAAEPARRFDALAKRRATGEPVAYLLGRRAFRALELTVDPRVLIPRPETELLVEVGLGAAPGARVLDVGSGSGAIALALADERPDLRVRGVDVSSGAVAVAHANALRLRLDVSFTVGDLLDGTAPGSVDVLLANLPYVPDDARLPVDVGSHEPASALRGGPDGLDVIRRLIDELPRVAAPLVALEIGAEQGDAVGGLLSAAGYTRVDVLADLAGRDRVVVGRAG